MHTIRKKKLHKLQKGCVVFDIKRCLIYFYCFFEYQVNFNSSSTTLPHNNAYLPIKFHLNRLTNLKIIKNILTDSLLNAIILLILVPSGFLKVMPGFFLRNNCNQSLPTSSRFLLKWCFIPLISEYWKSILRNSAEVKPWNNLANSNMICHFSFYLSCKYRRPS